MNWLDALLLLFLLVTLVRGTEVGFVRQFFSTVGLFGGLFLGAWLSGKLSPLAHSVNDRAMIAIFITAACALAAMMVGEYAGWRIKFKLSEANIIDRIDRILGAALAGVTLLAMVWLSTAIVRNLPDGVLERQIRTSHIVSALNQELPSAPDVLTSLGHLIEPNGFPQVFTGLEPAPRTNIQVPNIGDLTAAVRADAASVVKVEGQGCGGIVEGSGFVAAADEIITNAHVVAGVSHPFVIDGNGAHHATVVFFDPNLDMAVLRASGLAGKPLAMSTQTAEDGAPVAIVGYPGGGDFSAKPAAILQTFTATGRNIYNQGHTDRQVYSLKGDVEQGNSGGPLIDKDGSVVGVVFARSTSYDNVGYALTADHVAQEFAANQSNTAAVSTGSCAE
ncbi:MAG TPA: MarP family serine protease [Candidatus Saccharimonadales bacterium]|nr:MarP family serine protease [Candidatus Saccharimonadales bacterium]